MTNSCNNSCGQRGDWRFCQGIMEISLSLMLVLAYSTTMSITANASSPLISVTNRLLMLVLGRRPTICTLTKRTHTHQCFHDESANLKMVLPVFFCCFFSCSGTFRLSFRSCSRNFLTTGFSWASTQHLVVDLKRFKISFAVLLTVVIHIGPVIAQQLWYLVEFTSNLGVGNIFEEGLLI